MRELFSKVAGALAALSFAWGTPAMAQDDEARWSIAIHGGAGTLARSDMTPEREAAYRASLQTALDAGAKVLRDGGAALDAVEAVITRLEDDEKFNAGRGAVFTWDETHELDSSIMDGRDRSAGAVAGVTGIRHPIRLARKVMTDSPHVMLSGRGAEEFAADNGLEIMPPEWFDTDARREALERLKAEKLSAIDVDIKFGTVGAVALDQAGNLAAGTSTGGMTGKRWNRIGDSPVIGAGTYADNRSCAVSATGWGEYFIRVGVAHEICTRLRLAPTIEKLGEEVALTKARAEASGVPSEDIPTGSMTIPPVSAQAIADGVMDEVKALGGDGGIILVTPDGEALFSFNTSGMYRGRATSEGTNEVAIFAGE